MQKQEFKTYYKKTNGADSLTAFLFELRTHKTQKPEYWIDVTAELYTAKDAETFNGTAVLQQL